MSDDGKAKVQELIEDIRTCMLTTVSDDGAIVSRPMTAQTFELDGDLWFFVAPDSATAEEIRSSPRVNAAFAGGSSWVSVAGTATVEHDAAKARELWNPMVEAWFPDGPDDPGVTLVRLAADTAEYWDSPGGKAVTVLNLVKSKVTGRPYDGGENETVEL